MKVGTSIASKKGFTIIELMIVIAIITILAMVIVPKAGIGKTEAKARGVEQDLSMVKAYIDMHRDELIVKEWSNYEHDFVKVLDGKKLLGMMQKEEDFMKMVNPYNKNQKGVTDSHGQGYIRVVTDSTGFMSGLMGSPGTMIIQRTEDISCDVKP